MGGHTLSISDHENDGSQSAVTLKTISNEDKSFCIKRGLTAIILCRHYVTFFLLFLALVDVNESINKERSECIIYHLSISNCFISHPSQGRNHDV